MIRPDGSRVGFPPRYICKRFTVDFDRTLAPWTDDDVAATLDDDRFFIESECDVDPALLVDGAADFFRPLFFDMMQMIYER